MFNPFANLFAGDANISSNGHWELQSFFSNGGNYAKKAGGAFIVLLGIILILFGGFKIFKAITGRAGSSGPEWFKAILALIIGGAFAVSGFKILSEVAGGGQSTVNNLGTSTVMPLLPAKIDILQSYLTSLI